MIRQIRMDGKWVECGCIMGGISIIWMEYGWNIDYKGGVWVDYGSNMGVIWVILVGYGWYGVGGMISIIKNGKFETF